MELDDKASSYLFQDPAMVSGAFIFRVQSARPASSGVQTALITRCSNAKRRTHGKKQFTDQPSSRSMRWLQYLAPTQPSLDKSQAHLAAAPVPSIHCSTSHWVFYFLCLLDLWNWKCGPRFGSIMWSSVLLRD